MRILLTSTILLSAIFSLVKINGERGIIRKFIITSNYVTYYTSSPLTGNQQRLMLKQKERFIAHAGGEIQGHKYTNSLEALNHSYKIGLRYFELDISSTRDGHLVAAHDWENWRTHTKFKGPLPPTLKQFNSYKILQQFTPLDSKAINEWFLKHKDAYLVTDKVDSPALIAKTFPFYRERVLSELFNWNSVREANKLGFKGVLVTADLLFATKEYTSKIKEFSINYISCSRQRIPTHLDKLLHMKEHGIKVYLYHTNIDGFNDLRSFTELLKFSFGIYTNNFQSIVTNTK